MCQECTNQGISVNEFIFWWNILAAFARCNCQGCRPRIFSCNPSNTRGCDCVNCRCMPGSIGKFFYCLFRNYRNYSDWTYLTGTLRTIFSLTGISSYQRFCDKRFSSIKDSVHIRKSKNKSKNPRILEYFIQCCT